MYDPDELHVKEEPDCGSWWLADLHRAVRRAKYTDTAPF